MGYSYTTAGSTAETIETDSPTSPPSEVASGSGGDSMTKLVGYVYAEGASESETKSEEPFTTPQTPIAGGDGGDPMVRFSGYTFSRAGSEAEARAERAQGRSVTATVKGFDGGAVAGSASLTNSEGAVVERFTDRIQFTLAAGPPDGVTGGDDLSPEASLDFEFSPSTGESTAKADVASVRSATVTIEFGALEGTVTDAYGEPISDAPVTLTASGSTVRTAADGSYRIQTAAGRREFSVIDGAIVTDVDITAFESSVRDFAYSGLTLRATLPDGSAIPNIRITAGGDAGVADDEGEVTLSRVPPGAEVTLTAGGRDIRTVPSPQELDIRREELTLGAGIRGSLVDARTGDRIVGCPCAMEGRAEGSDKLRMLSTPSGDFRVGVVDVDKAMVYIAEDDTRYQTVRKVVDLSDQEVQEIDFELVRAGPGNTF